MDFDADYYDRFYRDPATRAASPDEQRLQAEFIAGYLRYLDIPINSITDIGCGLGILLQQLGAAFPDAACTGVEFSTYLCDTHGWVHGSVLDYEAAPQDLVICTDVLGYLQDAQCRQAIARLANLTRQALYLSVLTREDLDICDTEHTDMRQIVRSQAWYREQLNRYFIGAGGGLFLKKPLSVAIWQLERT